MQYDPYCLQFISQKGLTNFVNSNWARISEKEVGVVVVFKGMGVVSDQEIMQMVGTEDKVMTKFAASLEECHRLRIFTQEQALKHIASKMRQKRFFSGPRKTPVEDARDMLVRQF